MRRRIAVGLGAVAGLGQHRAVGADDHRSRSAPRPALRLHAPRRSARSIGESSCRDGHSGENSRNRVGLKRGGRRVMRFSFSAEQEEFRASRAARPGGALADQGGAPADGDRRGLRARRLEEAQSGARPHRPPHPRGLWRRRLRLFRAGHRARGDGPRPALRAVLLDRGAGDHRDPECRHGRAEEGAAARPRRRHGDRHPRLRRGRRQHRCRERRADGVAVRRDLAARRHQELRARRPHRRSAGRAWRAGRARSGEDGLSFFTVDGNASGLVRRKLKTMDETRKLAHLTFQSSRPGCSATKARAPRPSPRPCSRR